MKISERLKTIGDLVPLSSYPLDFGCAHALFTIYLVTEKNFPMVAASDNKKGPLEQAKKNASSYQVSSKIHFILAEGLAAYQEGMDAVTISGMGGLTINRILLNHKEILKNIKTFILSPNNYSIAVKRNLVKLGYFIKEEYIVKEKNIFYPILIFERGKKFYFAKDLFLGPILKNKGKDPLVREYYLKELKEKEALLKALPSSFYQKKKETKKEINWLKSILF